MPGQCHGILINIVLFELVFPLVFLEESKESKDLSLPLLYNKFGREVIICVFGKIGSLEY